MGKASVTVPVSAESGSPLLLFVLVFGAILPLNVEVPLNYHGLKDNVPSCLAAPYCLGFEFRLPGTQSKNRISRTTSPLF